MPDHHLLDAAAARQKRAPLGSLAARALARLLVPWSELGPGREGSSAAHVEARRVLERLSARLGCCALASAALLLIEWGASARLLRALAPLSYGMLLALAGTVAVWGALPVHEQALRAARARALHPSQVASAALALALALAALPALTRADVRQPEALRDLHVAPLLSCFALLMMLGERLLQRMLRSSAHHLRRLSPAHAHQVLEGQEQEVELSALQPGQVVRVRPREIIPVDGVVLSGRSSVHEQRVTGEWLPLDKRPGSPVIGGTLNGRGILLIRVVRDCRSGIIAALVRHVRLAEHTRSSFELRAQRGGRALTLLVLGCAFSLPVMLLLTGCSARPALLGSVAVLAASGPGLLPWVGFLAFRLGLLRSVQAGVLVDSAGSLESLAKVNALVVGSAATLREGRPRVISVVSGEESGDHQVLSLAAGLLLQSQQPIARAVLARAGTLQAAPEPVEDVHELAGIGSLGRLGSARVGLGNRHMLELLGIKDPLLEAKADALCDHGQTVVFVACNGRVRGLIGLVDPLKLTTRDALRELEDEGLRVILCTAEAGRTAQHLVAQLGDIELFADVPRVQKAAVVRKLIERGERVAFASRSPHEERARECAHVAIDLSIESELGLPEGGLDTADDPMRAHVTLVRGDLAALARARRLSRATLTTARRGVAWAWAYHVLAVPLASGILGAPSFISRAPLVASCVLFGCLLLLVGNALLLLRREL